MRLFILIFILSASHTYAQNNNKWKLTKNKNGIKIYTRHSEHSPIKEVKGVMKLKVSLSSIVSLIKDAKNQHNWIYLNKTAYLLKEPSNFEWYYYNESDAPWPISNRDIVTHAKLKQNPTTYALRIEAKGVPDYIDEKEGIVRIRKLASSWDIVPINDGFVQVTFKLFADLGGSVPAWAINLAIDTGPFNTLSAMSEEIKRDKYKNAKCSFIKEKPIE